MANLDGINIVINVERAHTQSDPSWRWGKKCYVYPGEMMPRGYGVAMVDWCMDRRICYPLPFNWVVAFADRFILWLQRPPVEREFARQIQARYQVGYDKGHKDGRLAGFDVGYAAGLIKGEENYVARINELLNQRAEARRV
jgi:hypothetical protein